MRDTAGVANERKRAQALGHKLARKLKVGDWIAVQARQRWSTAEIVHYRAGHYWVGRVVDAGKKHHLGDGVLKQVTARRETINDTMFTEGDIAIAVQWYDRTSDDDDGLSFTKWCDPEGDAATQCIINSTELRAASSTPFENGLQFTMAPELVETPIQPAFKPTPQVTPAVTRSGRKAAVVELAAEPVPQDDAVFVMPARVDQEIRRGCWMRLERRLCSAGQNSLARVNMSDLKVIWVLTWFNGGASHSFQTGYMFGSAYTGMT